MERVEHRDSGPRVNVVATRGKESIAEKLGKHGNPCDAETLPYSWDERETTSTVEQERQR